MVYPPRRRVQEKERRRLQNLPRYQRTTTTLMGQAIHILDAESFLIMHKDIVEDAIYAFPAKNRQPYIIDGGANIGISVLYFKQMYPEATIIAFEPDEDAFSLLKMNVESRDSGNVTLINRALAAVESDLAFVSEGSYAGRLAGMNDQGTAKVRAVRLRHYLNRQVDLIKLNIEGAETSVLMDCADLLDKVERIVLEYHSFADEEQRLHTLLSLLANAGYRLYVGAVHTGTALQPFVNLPIHLGMDLQLYVYAYRENV